jgi:two-component system sensor histidine kinase YesM
MRLDDGITYEKQVDEELLDTKILRFIIQPVVENAITHGFEKSAGKGNILLRAFKKNNVMIISVTDNGSGMSEGDIAKLNELMSNGKDSRGIGLMNTNRRLRLQYGMNYGVNVEHGDMCGLNVIMTLPIEELEIYYYSK